MLNNVANPNVPSSDNLHRELRQVQESLDSDPATAASLAGEIIGRYPGAPAPYRLLGTALRRLGRNEEAERAESEAISISARSPDLIEAAQAILGRHFDRAEHLIRSRLESDPEDAEALRLLADIAATAGHHQDAERLLRRTIGIAPAFVAAYVNLATLLQNLGRSDEAIALLDAVSAEEPRHHWTLSLKAALLVAEQRLDEAIQTHEELLGRAPEASIVWMNYGYALKTVGRIDDAVAAYRRSLQLAPGNGFAWWGLANLKTVRLDARDTATMQEALQGASDDLQQIQLHFALGKGLGDQARFEQSFRHYAAGNDLRRRRIPYEARLVTEAVRKTEALFTSEFLQARAGNGCAAADPIFIVGMPRSGSTLVEQILASHPLIEGAGELVELEKIAARIDSGAPVLSSWLDKIANLQAEDLRTLGEAYLGSTRAHRMSERPFFTDKMPFNWRYIGLILLILPNAKIIDVRRHPLGCCFSNFALYFNRQTNFASSLEDLGIYYRDYVRMTAHFDRIAPSRIYRVTYEKLVEDCEREVRLMLDHLGLPFDEACMRFYDNRRAVHTPSAQQVRMPINTEGLEHWRGYEPWLGPLQRALGPVLEVYPAVPEEWPG